MTPVHESRSESRPPLSTRRVAWAVARATILAVVWLVSQRTEAQTARQPRGGGRSFDTPAPGGNPRELDGDPLAGDDDPDLESDRALTRLLARWFPDPVDPRTSLAEPDIREPGPDTANFPNSPYTLPRGWVYLETSPLTYTTSVRDLQTSTYNWEYLLRVGLTDRVEFRFFGNGLTASAAGGGAAATSGFSPVVFDTKIHFSDEVPEWFMPATGMEVYVQTPWGSPAFNVGTQPGIMMLFRNSLPWGIKAEWNVGVVGDQASGDAVGFTDAVQWSFEKEVADGLSLFLQGFKNQAALPRVANQTVVGGGFIRTFGRRYAMFGSWNYGTDRAGPTSVIQFGGARAF
ncbi:MAG: hypothetical protein EBX35_01190 [Planctomycetia bacterium]|jgi:hypothetical protein|nr:hypothetical protein [Planctomycetia bacterium]